MVAGCFGNIGTNEYTLADLSVNGYTNSYLVAVAWVGGCKAGEFRMDVLKNDGNPSASYYWIDATVGTKFSSQIFEPGWYVYVTGNPDPVKMTKEEVAKVKFSIGQAFWTAGSGYNLVSAGEVVRQRIEYATNKENFTAIGNGMPASCGLGDLYVNGYTNSYLVSVAWVGGCKAGEFRMDVLKNDGNPSASYYWIDATVGTKFSSQIFEPGWYVYITGNPDPVKMTTDEVAKVKFSAGQGFWIAGSGYNLVIPSPLAEEKPVE